MVYRENEANLEWREGRERRIHALVALWRRALQSAFSLLFSLSLSLYLGEKVKAKRQGHTAQVERENENRGRKRGILGCY